MKFIGPVNFNAEAFVIARYFEKNSNSILYIGKDDREIKKIFYKLKWIFPEYKILLYRSWDQIPYDKVSPSKEKKIILTTVASVIQKTLPQKLINSKYLRIKRSDKINFEDLILKLNNLGYERVTVVRDRSEFAVRGSILDIFLTTYDLPIRLDFFDDEIENIYDFDPISQKRLSKNKINDFIIQSTCELILDKENIDKFRRNFRKIFSDYRKSKFYDLFSDSIIPSGGEQYLPLFYDDLGTLFDYLDNYSIFINNDFEKVLDNRIENINDFYNVRNNSLDEFCLNPNYLYLNTDQINQIIKTNNSYKLSFFFRDNFYKSYISPVKNLSVLSKEIDFKFIEKYFNFNLKNKKIIICCRTYGSLERVKNILNENTSLSFNLIEHYYQINENQLNITILEIEESFQIKDTIYINEKSIFGYFFNTRKKKSRNKEFLFEELNKLSQGSILVHEDYGLCKFNNIKKVNLNESIHDCLELEFADNQKLFLPVENLNCISKYGNDSENILFLDKLGSSNWKKRKNKAKKKIIEVAKKLIKIASSRLKSESYNINTNHIDYDKFCSTFQYVETDDQTNSIQDIINDFDKNIPSDRLIVGDVAYGKTEIIIRAIFLAAKSNIQSVVLVPTTLLSKQHFENFQKRFSLFNINIEQISRLVSSKKRNDIFKKCEIGEIDVLIGTHSLLNDKLLFKNLGLIVYDEEQKLGTLQKEKLKQIAPKAHVISLSATPIPRTLSMALSGIRDLSLILTAPFERLSVRCYVSPFDEITIIEAIKREIYGRKNGVYFVTPRKKDIPFIENFLNKNLPDIKFIITHGQLPPKILEDRVSKFYNKEVPIMVSTNIIENGLDLPHVNTIIVYRANLFSLSSLYQLKGRVGRSSNRGYAYITYKENELTDNGKKRLSIINSSTELGSGFNIATQDLDIRGGGSIIGEEQSGFIREIGTELYYQLLEEEIKLQKYKIFKDEEFNTSFKPNIKLSEEIYIPENYIDNIDLRLSIYRRISNITNTEQINDLLVEMNDRFGKIPKEFLNLFKLIELKIMCIKNKIDYLEFSKKGVVFGFHKNKPLNPKKILKITLDKSSNFSLRSDQKIFYKIIEQNEYDTFKFTKKLISNF